MIPDAMVGQLQRAVRMGANGVGFVDHLRSALAGGGFAALPASLAEYGGDWPGLRVLTEDLLPF